MADDGALDLAILDIDLNGEFVFPVADKLAERETPLLFITGYDAALIPRRFAQYGTLEKSAVAGELAFRPPAEGAAGMRARSQACCPRRQDRWQARPPRTL